MLYLSYHQVLSSLRLKSIPIGVFSLRRFCESQSIGHNNGPLSVLEARIRSGELKSDSHQLAVAKALQVLYDEVRTYTPPTSSYKSGLFSWLGSSRKEPTVKIQKGLYIHGSVGGGKTMLMDLFYDNCDVVSVYRFIYIYTVCVLIVQFMFKVAKKQRVHFNSFMTNIHAQIHNVKYQESHRRAAGDTKPNAFDPTKPVADMLAAETWLICFDEFQVR